MDICRISLQNNAKEKKISEAITASVIKRRKDFSDQEEGNGKWRYVQSNAKRGSFIEKQIKTCGSPLNK